jgi:hypothetical protein
MFCGAAVEETVMALDQAVRQGALRRNFQLRRRLGTPCLIHQMK